MMKRLSVLWIFLLCAIISFDSLAQFTSVASGPWNADATWSGTGIPVAGSTVTIANGHTVTVTAAAACASITFAGAATNTTLTINSGITLNVSGTITIPQANAGISNTLAVGAGTLTAGSVAFTAGGAASTRHRITISTGTVAVSGNVTQTGSSGSALISFSGAGLLQLGGTLYTPATGTLTTFAGSTVEYNGAAQTVQPFAYLGDLILSGTGAKTTTGITVTDTLSMEGTAAVTASAAITCGTLQYNSTANKTVGNEWPSPFTAAGGVVIKNTGTITLNALKQLGNNTNVPLNIRTGATLSTNNFGLTFHGDFFRSGTLTAGSSAIIITGTTATQSIAGFTTTGTVSFGKTAGTATLTGNVGGGAFTINGGAGGTLNLGAGLTHTFTGVWNRIAGVVNGGSSILRIGGDVVGAGGTFTASTGTVDYNGAAQTASVVIYNNLTLSGSGAKTFATTPTVNGVLSLEGTADVVVTTGVVTYGANATLQYNKPAPYTATAEEWITPFVATGGVIIANTGAITLNTLKQFGNNTNVPLNINTGATLVTSNLGLTFHGDFINDGTLTAGSSPVIITGTTATHSIGGFTTTGLISMTKTGGTATFTGNANGSGLTINGTGGTLNLGTGLTHTLTGNWTRTAGTLDGGSSTLRIAGTVSGAGGTFNASSGTIEYNGAAQTVAAVIYNNLTLSGSGAKTLTGLSTIGGDFTMSGTATATPSAALTIGGAFTLGGGTIFTAGSLSHNIAGDWINNGGTFTNTSSTINFVGSNQTIGGSSSTTFNRVAMGGSGTKTLGIATFIGDNLYVFSGVVINLGSITTHTATTLTLSGSNQLSGTWGCIASSATNRTDTYFTAGTSGILTVASSLSPQIYYSRATGNWNSSSTWSTVSFSSAVNTGSYPVVGDIVNIGGGDFVITVNVNSACASISFVGNSNNSPSISLGAGITLDVAGAIDLPNGLYTPLFTFDSNTIAVGAGILNAGSIDFRDDGGGELLTGTNNLTISSGTVTITGNVTGGLGGATNITISGSGTLNLGGTFLTSADVDFTASANSTVNYNGATQTIGDFTYGNLTLSGSGTKTITTTTDINGSVSIGVGTTLVAGAFSHTVGGDWTNDGSFTHSGGTITFDGAAQNIGGTNSTTFNNLELNGSSIKTFGAASFSAGYFAVGTGASVDLGGFTTHTANSLSLGGIGQIAGVWGGTGSGAANTNATYFGISPTTSGRITTATGGSSIYYTRADGPWTTFATWSNVGYGGAAATSFPTAGSIVNIGGGDFDVTVNAVSACATLNFQGDAAFTTTVTINAGQSLTVSGAVNLANGAYTPLFTFDSNTLAVGAGTLTAGSLNFIDGGDIGTHAFTISTGTATITGDVTGGLGTALTTINITGAGTLNLGGAFLTSADVGFTAATTSTVNYNGAAQSIGDFTYGNLTLSGSGTKTMTDVTDINGAVTIGVGTTLVAGAFDHTVGGNWVNNGSFTHSGATLTFDGAAQNIGGTNSTTFNNIALNGTGTTTFGRVSTSAGSFSVGNGAFVNLGGFNHTANSLALGNIGQIAGVWGGVGSGAANTNNTYFGTNPATSGTLTTSVAGSSTFYSRATGLWNTPGTWSNVTYGGAASTIFPVAGSVVNIGGGNFTVTVDGTSACSTVNFQTGTGNSPVLSVTTGTLTVSGAINLTPATTFNSGVNTVSVAGTLNTGSIAFTTALLTNSPLLTISTGVVTVSGDVTQSGFNNAAVTFTGAGTLRLRGAFLNSNNCTFTRGTGTIEYAGTAVAQTIGDFTYNNLTFNNTSATAPQITLPDNTTVISTLTMTSGRVNLNNFTLTLGASGAASTLTRTASTTTNWVYNGTFSRFWPVGAVTSTSGNFYGLFPLGASGASTYRPVSINSTANPTGTGSFSIRHNDVSGSTDISPVFNDGGTNIVRKNNAQFVTSTTATGGTYNIGVTMTGLSATGAIADIRLAVSNSGATATAVGTHLLATGTVSNPTANRTGVALASLVGDFRIATTNSVATPLPIELVSFTGNVVEDKVQLTWVTESEINNDFFTVERSTSGEVFSSIGQVNGNATTSQRHTYDLIDSNPIAGKAYYRLKQTDFDGTFTYSNIISVTNEGPESVFMNIYPNPSNGSQVTLEVKGLKNTETFPVFIYDQLGRQRSSFSLDVDKISGTAAKIFSLKEELPEGVYIVRAGPNQMLVKRLIVTQK